MGYTYSTLNLLCTTLYSASIAVTLAPQSITLPAGCESEVEQQQLLCLANMLQSRALQSHPTAPHRYSLPSAQLQSMHPRPPGEAMHPKPPGGSPVTDLTPSSPRAGQAVGQGSASPSMSHAAAISHSQQGMPPLSACCVDDQLQPQHGDPMVPMMSEQQRRSLLKDCQDAHTAGLHSWGLEAQGLNPHQVCCDNGQSSGSHPYSSYKGGQASQQPRGYVAHAAGHSSLPQVHHQPFHPTVSRLGPSRRPQATVQPVLPYQNLKVCSPVTTHLASSSVSPWQEGSVPHDRVLL